MGAIYAYAKSVFPQISEASGKTWKLNLLVLKLDLLMDMAFLTKGDLFVKVH